MNDPKFKLGNSDNKKISLLKSLIFKQQNIVRNVKILKSKMHN